MIELKHWHKNKSDIFCKECRLLYRWCYCEKIEKVNLKTKFHIIVHHKDWSLSSNTINLARMTLNNSKIYLRGLKDQEIPEKSFDLPQENTFFLYPDENSIPITDIVSSSNEYNIIVPDGSWGQARKFKKRINALQKFQSVHIPFSKETIYFLRREKYKNHLCTYEAMAETVGHLESDTKKNEMLRQLSYMVEHTLLSRAKKQKLLLLKDQLRKRGLR